MRKKGFAVRRINNSRIRRVILEFFETKYLIIIDSIYQIKKINWFVHFNKEKKRIKIKRRKKVRINSNLISNKDS